MFDDQRIKRVLKRYRKEEQFSDASMDVGSFGIAALMQACRCDDVNSLNAPKELDDHAVAHFANLMGIDFDHSQFDYFLHAYLRSEFLEAYRDDPSVASFPASEDGPPSKIPVPKGMRWCAVRPKDGKEHYLAVEIDGANDGAS
jgi:hypothetical protein